MGKKTNWTVSEDQALCRAWMNASDTGYTSGSDHKASTFWNAVHIFFHQELDTTIARPLNGLKIRWTRINRDVQKFGLCFAQVMRTASASASTEEEETDDGITQEMIEEAKELYQKEQGTKFLFEICWKLLRLHPKWIQLLRSSTNNIAMNNNHTLGGTKSHHHLHHQQQQDHHHQLVYGTISSNNAIERIGGSEAQKRRHQMMTMDSHTTATTSSSSSIRDLTQLLTQEIERRNELLEEQNAIHLFTKNLKENEEEDVKKYFTLLRQKYLKKIKFTLLNHQQESTTTTTTTSNTKEKRGDNDDDDDMFA
jgi:hypothetical protein